MAIVDYAEESSIDMIVMGSHHRSGLSRIVSTSTPSQVLKAATCPVVIVPTDCEAHAATLAQIVRILHEAFGDCAPGDRQAAWVQMRETLERNLNLSFDEADSALQQLQKTAAVVWELSTGEISTATGSAWHIKPSLVEDDDAQLVFKETAASPTPSPATDLLTRAFALRATDIHIDPGQDGSYTVRMRIDGQLEL